MRVVDVMIRNPICCTELCTAVTVAKLLKQAECGVVPVLDPLSQHVVGVVTERSLCLEVMAAGRNPARVPASECLAHEPAVCHPADDAYVVLARLSKSKARGVVVINDDSELEGVLSLSGLASRAANAAQELYNALQKAHKESVGKGSRLARSVTGMEPGSRCG